MSGGGATQTIADFSQIFYGESRRSSSKTTCAHLSNHSWLIYTLAATTGLYYKLAREKCRMDINNLRFDDETWASLPDLLGKLPEPVSLHVLKVQ